jgi:hypothetical protein
MARFNKVLILLFVLLLQLLIAADDETKIFERSDFRRERTAALISISNERQDFAGFAVEDIARLALEENSQILGLDIDRQDFQLLHSLSSPAGTHITFRPTIKGVPVYAADITVTLNRSNRIVSISSGYRPFYSNNLNSVRLSQEAAVEIVKNHLQIRDEILFGPESELMIFNSITYGPTTVYRVKLVTLSPFGDWEAFIHAGTGAVLQLRDRMRYQTYHDGKGLVYNPDPLTRVQAAYGGQYRDGDDSDTPELNAARDTVILNELYFDGTNYHLQGPYCRVMDVEPPVDVLPVFSSPDSFYFSRSQTGFESVMAYYHIDKSYRRLSGLGFEIPALNEFKVDAHGFSGADNSHFSQTGNYCAFGEGGIDDAEDADVIWHEYSHAIQYHITGDMLYEGETMAVMEGSADYWAASYSRSLSDYNWHQVYNWDGHNEFWEGRFCDKEWHYPEDIQSFLYDNREYEAGQLWSSVLMNIWSELGRDITDRLFIQMHYLWGIDPGFQGAANAFIMADSLLYDGAHLGRILYWFDRYGLVAMNDYLAKIEHTPLKDNEQTLGPFLIEAIITPGKSVLDENGLYLYWEDAVGSLDSAQLEPGDGQDTYTAEIRGSAQTGWIKYYLSVLDFNGNEVTAPPGAPETYYAFYAGPDTVKPQVTYVPLTDQLLSTWPPMVRLIATDNMGISTATVDYHLNQMGEQGSFLLDEEEVNKVYGKSFTIAGDSPQPGDSIFYRITVRDKALSSNTKVVPNSGYFAFKIEAGGQKHYFNFEENNGGLTASGDWEWGRPTSGPEKAYDGQNCWATYLNSRYSNVSQASTLSLPDIDLSGYIDVSLSFYHWYETEAGFDGGNVKISIDGGSNWVQLSPVSGYDMILEKSQLSGEEAFSGSSRDWRFCEFNLTAFRNQTIRIKFDFSADNATSFQGWYIDDVMIKDSPVFPPVKSVYAVSGYDYGIPISWYLPDNRSVMKTLSENDEVSSDEVSSLVGYHIYRKTLATDTFDSLSTIYNPERTSIIDSTVVLNRPYTYMVKTIYMDGESYASYRSSAISSKSAEIEMIDQTTYEIETLSVANNGNLGYTHSAKKDRFLGNGMIVNGDSVLNEGSFMMGMSPSLLSDAAYNELGIFQGDFMPITPVLTSQHGNWIQSQSIFNDGYASLPLGFQVKQNVFSREGDKFIIWTAQIINYSGTDVTELIAGFYFDWQLETGEYGNELYAAWEGELLDAGYLTGESQTFGIVLLSHYHFHSFRILDNATETDRMHMTKWDKWNYLKHSNIPADQTLKDRSQIFSISLSDYGNILYEGDSLFVSFAIISAGGISDFEEQCGLAFQAYTDLGYKRSGLIIKTEDKKARLPDTYFLSQNYPNPFNPATMIDYQLPITGNIDISVYNVLGQKIKTLVSDRQQAGYYQILWNGDNHSGQTVASGVYFYKIEAGNFVKVRKMLYLK